MLELGWKHYFLLTFKTGMKARHLTRLLTGMDLVMLGKIQEDQKIKSRSRFHSSDLSEILIMGLGVKVT